MSPSSGQLQNPDDPNNSKHANKSVLRFVDFRKLIMGRLMITLSVNMQVIAIGWQIWSLTRSPFALGMVGLFGFLPLFLAALFAGHLIDRFERQRILTLTYAVHFGTALALVLIVTLAEPAQQVYLIYPVVAFMSLARAFVMPSYQALTPNVVPREFLSKAIALSSSALQFSVAFGPALGGIILAFGDIVIRPIIYGDYIPNGSIGIGNNVVFIVAALFQFIAVFLAATMKTRSQGSLNRGMSLALFFSGFNFIRVRRVIFSAIALDLFAVLLGGATALMPIYADEILKVGPLGLGLLRSAPAFGALSVGYYLSRRPLGTQAGRAMIWAVAGFGVATIVFGLSENLILSMFALAIMGATDMISMYVRQNLIQVGTPDDMRGRVGAVTSIFISTSNEIGEFESGLAAQAFGVVPSVVLGGAGTILCAVIWRVYFKELATVDLTKEGQDKLAEDGHAASQYVIERMDAQKRTRQ